MGRITGPLCALTQLNGRIAEAITRLAQQTDDNQWPLAGIELGKIAAYAEAIQAIVPMAKDGLWYDSEEFRVRELNLITLAAQDPSRKREKRET